MIISRIAESISEQAIEHLTSFSDSACKDVIDGVYDILYEENTKILTPLWDGVSDKIRSLPGVQRLVKLFGEHALLGARPLLRSIIPLAEEHSETQKTPALCVFSMEPTAIFFLVQVDLEDIFPGTAKRLRQFSDRLWRTRQRQHFLSAVASHMTTCVYAALADTLPAAHRSQATVRSLLEHTLRVLPDKLPPSVLLREALRDLDVQQIISAASVRPFGQAAGGHVTAVRNENGTPLLLDRQSFLMLSYASVFGAHCRQLVRSMRLAARTLDDLMRRVLYATLRLSVGTLEGTRSVVEAAARVWDLHVPLRLRQHIRVRQDAPLFVTVPAYLSSACRTEHALVREANLLEALRSNRDPVVRFRGHLLYDLASEKDEPFSNIYVSASSSDVYDVDVPFSLPPRLRHRARLADERCERALAQQCRNIELFMREASDRYSCATGVEDLLVAIEQKVGAIDSAVDVDKLLSEICP